MNAKQSKASIRWNGKLEDGFGSLSTESGVLNDEVVTWSARTGNASGMGTNPEEMLAAAHATCFAMSLAHRLDDDGYDASDIDVTATCFLDRQQFGGIAIKRMELDVTASIAGLDEPRFQEIAEKVELHCPVTKAISGNVTVHVDAHLRKLATA
jgi:osmotically inducible protein OsmC